MAKQGAAAEKVNHPAHYNKGKIEVIDFIEDQQLGFHLGNVVKYVCRYRELVDLEKASWYLRRFIACEKLKEVNRIVELEKSRRARS